MCGGGGGFILEHMFVGVGVGRWVFACVGGVGVGMWVGVQVIEKCGR